MAGGGTGPEICTVAADCQYGGGRGTLGGEFPRPSIATPVRLCIYVADNGNERIQKFDLDGISTEPGARTSRPPVTGFENCTVATNCQQGIQGAGNGELDLPNGVAATATFVYVTDTDNHRVNKYDTAGRFQRSWGKDVPNTGGTTGLESCTLPGTCKAGVDAASAESAYPNSIAAGPVDEVYVTESGNSGSRSSPIPAALAAPGEGRRHGRSHRRRDLHHDLELQDRRRGDSAASSPARPLAVDLAGDVYEAD